MLLFIFALIIGLLLGITGGGGSILAVPVLVYFLNVPVVLATGYSLFIVGITSLFGIVAYHKKKLIHYRSALYFAIPSVVAVYVVRVFVLPALPDIFFTIGSFQVSKSLFLMLLFAALMMGTAYSMITSKCDMQWESENKEIAYNYPLILLEGSLTGVLSGLVGAGGGFLIVPALVIFSRLPMKTAVGTSLVIIAAKSLIGFLGEIQTGILIDWQLLLQFSAFTIIGMLAGAYFSSKINACQLRKGFGYFVVIMSIIIVAKELLFK